MDSIKSDSAKVSLVLSSMNAILPDVSREQLASSWNVLLLKRKITVDFDVGYPVTFNLTFPPIPMLDTSASSMYSAMFEVAFTSEPEKAISKLKTYSAVNFNVRGNDGAHSNLKLDAHESSYLPFHSRIHCFSHANGLVEVAAEAHAARGCASRKCMQNVSKLSRTAGMFTRFLASVRPCIAKALSLKDGPPPARATQYCDELENYFKRNHRMYKDALHRLGLKPSVQSQATAIYNRRWIEFRKWWNGELWVEGRCIHYLDGKVLVRDDVVVGMATSYIRLMLASIIVSPESGKWTLLGPAVDFMVGNLVPHGMLKDIVLEGFGELSIKFDSYVSKYRDAINRGEDTLGE